MQIFLFLFNYATVDKNKRREEKKIRIHCYDYYLTEKEEFD